MEGGDPLFPYTINYLMMFEYSQKYIYHLRIDEFPKGEITETWLHIINNGIGEPVRIPMIIARGMEEGPILGLTAALHGNELNGIPVIQRLFKQLDVNKLRGTIVGVLVANVPALLLEQRRFVDDVDLNRIAPGKRDGNRSELYIYRLINRIVKHFDYLIDLHTASFGRVNSYYIRADMDDPVSARMALLQNPDIILHNPPRGRSLRGNADDRDIKSITVELKDPHVFQYDVIEDSLIGIRNVLYDLKMLKGRISYPEEHTMLCRDSYWIYTDEGGILRVLPKLGQQIQKGQKIAEVQTIFGKVVKTYEAPRDGIIIGKSVNPINQSGSRIVHLGIDFEQIPSRIDPQVLEVS